VLIITQCKYSAISPTATCKSCYSHAHFTTNAGNHKLLRDISSVIIRSHQCLKHGTLSDFFNFILRCHMSTWSLPCIHTIPGL